MERCTEENKNIDNEAHHHKLLDLSKYYKTILPKLEDDYTMKVNYCFIPIEPP
jgi:hypothetical protein